MERAVANVVDVALGGGADPTLPERVRRRIEQQQAIGEIIIGWVQASAIVFFALVYALSPKAFPPGTSFEPVPWTLAIYALFTAVRIVLAHRRRLSSAFVTTSVVVDVVVLMITIWSFHLQYRAPPALYLKAPTLMYVFILIGLRTLRFEPRFVLIAGGCAALGWICLSAYAAWNPGGRSPAFTHSYIEYVTSYKILLGAEIDKVWSILMVTGIFALSLARARKLLASSIVEQMAAADLSHFLAPEIAEQLRHAEVGPAAGEGVRRDAAIVSVDMRGFTGMAHSMPAGELIALLGEYQARFVPIIHNHGGKIDKYLGDGILASFGAVVPTKTYAADLCRAVEDLVEAAQAWQAEGEGGGLATPAVGIAGAAGDVVFGTIGYGGRLEYTVIGEAVNLAVKLEKLTKNEAVPALLPSSTYALAIAQGYRPQHAIDLRRARPIDGLADLLDVVAILPR
ncbi:adenylate cyclase [Tistlia consotensis]|uniref:Adenylate cyclase n=1 Tax=Tistlia consotensis USBA 355 TaxID=560819 RepID=A0A1Y6BTC2_9PROT|nr:adenylate/guanylate cyclase domain-containing protein [Tistlia consotensis]SMF26352.1 adenylate cyclase [Tistlia consotensis USBA 355]SNR67243.1 adenylate cyclase [Tistlia consotensis]